MKSKVKSIILLITIITISLLLLGCGNDQSKEKISMILDWTPNTNHTGLYVAQAKGYYHDQGLEVKIEQPPEGDALLFVATGKAPFCISAQESIAAALDLEEPMPVTAIAAIVNHNTSGILSLKEKNIQSFKDLENKAYATWDIPIYDEVLKDVVTSDGGDFNQIIMVPNNATDTITALETDFDAVWVFYGWDGIIAKLKGLETNYLPFNEENPILDYYTPIIAANNDYITENPEITRNFMEATAKGYEYAAANPKEAAAILLEAAPEIGEDIAMASQKYLSEQYLAEAEVWGLIDQNRWDNFFNWMYEKDMLKNKFASGIGMDNSFLPQIE